MGRSWYTVITITQSGQSSQEGRRDSVNKLRDEITKAVINANLGLNPQNNGEVIIISVPVLTEERRKDLVKTAKSEGENAKVSIRSQRKDANDMIKSLKEEGLSEDEVKDSEEFVQKLTDTFTKKVDDLVAVKEVDIMKV